jgi:hypothetical protein
MFWKPALNYWACFPPDRGPGCGHDGVAYLTADFEAITSFFSDPDKFVKANLFPYFICALIVLVFGPGRFSVDALIKWKLGEPRCRGTEGNSFKWSSQIPTKLKVQN